MASYIFTLGFHEDFIIRRLMNSKTSKGERIIVFTVSPVSGASEKAFKNLEAFCATTGLSRPELVEIKVSGREFIEIVYDIISVLKDLEEPIIADLSGGMRILVIATYIGVEMSRKRSIVYVAQESGQGEEYKIDIEEIRILSKEYSEEK
nr:CRISPR locus-related DNA-binding protein [Desulfurococcales archaeon]